MSFPNTSGYQSRAKSRLSFLFLTAWLLFPLTPAFALTAKSVFPANLATNVCIDTPLKISFDTVPKPGVTGAVKIYQADGTLVDTIDFAPGCPLPRKIGAASLNAYQVLITGITATIFPHAGVLSYNTNYHVTVDAAAFSGFAGLSGPTAWKFKTKSAAPPVTETCFSVAADGTGDFCTVQRAIDFIPAGNTTKRHINIRSGVYHEIVRLDSKHNITFRGQDRKRAIIGYPNNNNINPGTNARAMFNVAADDVFFENLTLTNTTPKGGSQAEALRVNGQRCVANHCDLHSYQDTLLVNSATDSAFFTDCLIEGNTDFIWGGGRVVFKDCEIKSLAGGYICQMRNPAAQYGAVFLDCRLTRQLGVTNVYLARIDPNKFPDSATAFVDCMMDSHMVPAGWLLTADGVTDGIRYGEYRSTDLSGTALDVSSRASFSAQIDPSRVASLRDLSAILGGWNPALRTREVSR